VPNYTTESVLKTVNWPLLDEQLRAVLGPGRCGSPDWFGFNNVIDSPGHWQVAAGPRTETDSNGTRTYQPGDLRFLLADDFSPAELTTLRAVLAAHDGAQRTAEQQRDLLDAQHWQELGDLFDLAAGDLGTLTNAQRTRLLWLLCRLVRRRLKRAAV